MYVDNIIDIWLIFWISLKGQIYCSLNLHFWFEIKINCLSFISTFILWTFAVREWLSYTVIVLVCFQIVLLWNWIWFHNFKQNRNKMNLIFSILRKLNLLIRCATKLNQKIQTLRNYNSSVWKHIVSDFLFPSSLCYWHFKWPEVSNVNAPLPFNKYYNGASLGFVWVVNFLKGCAWMVL